MWSQAPPPPVATALSASLLTNGPLAFAKYVILLPSLPGQVVASRPSGVDWRAEVDIRHFGRSICFEDPLLHGLYIEDAYLFASQGRGTLLLRPGQVRV